MSDNDTAARIAVLESKTDRALNEVAGLRGDLQQVLEQTGCTIPGNLETDKAMRDDFKTRRIRERIKAEREAERQKARREFFAGFGVFAGLVTMLTALGSLALSYFDSTFGGGGL